MTASPHTILTRATKRAEATGRLVPEEVRTCCCCCYCYCCCCYYYYYYCYLVSYTLLFSCFPSCFLTFSHFFFSFFFFLFSSLLFSFYCYFLSSFLFSSFILFYFILFYFILGDITYYASSPSIYTDAFTYRRLCCHFRK